MKDQMGESGDIGADLEFIRAEQSNEYEVTVSRDTLDHLSELVLVEVSDERRIYTDPKNSNHISPEDFQKRLGPTLLNKFADTAGFGADELGRIHIRFCYREVNALALVSLGRPFEDETYGREFWTAVLEGKFDHHRMIEQGRSLYPYVLETVVSFVEAGGKDPYNLRDVFERLTKIAQ